MAKKPTNDDPNRLAQVDQADLAESRVNEEFVDWLRKWGNTILLVVLVFALGAMGLNWLKRNAEAKRDTAWASLTQAQLPSSLEDVARESVGVDAVSSLALLAAADQYLASVQSGTRFDRDETSEEFVLDDATRTEFLGRAETLYAEAIVSIGSYETDFAKKILVISALFGQAAIAECQGDVATATQHLNQIQKIAPPQYDDLAAQAGERIESIGVLATAVVLPADADLPKPPTPAPVPDPEALIGNIEPAVTIPAVEPVTEPAVAPAVEPVTEPATEPAPEPATEPAPEPATEPAPVPATEPAPEPATEPAPVPATEPAPEPATEPAPVPATEPAPEPATEPAPVPATEPAPVPATEPAPEPATEPAPEPATEPAPEPATEPAPEPATEPAPETPGG